MDWTDPGAIWDRLAANVSAPAVIASAAAVGVLLLGLIILAVSRALRRKDLNAKASVGFAVVQAGVTFAVVTGVYDFWLVRVGLPKTEAGVMAVFIEASTWAAVGFIVVYAKTPDRDGKDRYGFGESGPFFWVTVVGGGVLAVLGSESVAVALGRVVVVVFGGYMWYLRLRQLTHRPTSKTRSQWRWTPRKLLQEIGALVPEEEDLDNELEEWKVRRLAQAMRRANSRWPFSWFGRRALIRRAESTHEDVLRLARRRYASAHLFATESGPHSPVMAQVIAEVRREHFGVTEQVEHVPAEHVIGERVDETEHVPAESVIGERAEETEHVPAVRHEHVPAVPPAEHVHVPVQAAPVVSAPVAVNGHAHTSRPLQVAATPVAVLAEQGSPEWLAAMEWLRDAVIRESDAQPAAGPEVIWERVQDDVPMLSPTEVAAFCADFLAWSSATPDPESDGTLPVSGPWRELLPQVSNRRREVERAQETDEVLINRHRAVLRKHWEDGSLTDYRVRKVCGVAGRQAGRILAALTSEWEVPAAE